MDLTYKLLLHLNPESRTWHLISYEKLATLFSTLLLLLSVPSLSQSKLSGNWTGTLYQNPQQGLKWTEYKFSMKLEEANGVVKGISTIMVGPNYGVIDLKGTFKDGILTFEEYRIEKEKMEKNFDWCLKSGKLTMKVEGKVLKLEGNWTGYTKQGNYRNECSPGRIVLTKEQGFISIKGFVINEKTITGVPAQIKIVKKSTGKQAALLKTNSGEFDIALPGGSEYELTIEAQGYLTRYENVTLTSSKILNIPITPIEVGKTVALSHVLFERSTASLTKDSYPALDRLYKFLIAHPTVRIELQGHTSNEGDASKNVELSAQRVKAIKNVLTEKGITATRIELKAFGDTHPIAPNDTEDHKKLNRRVEFLILEK